MEDGFEAIEELRAVAHGCVVFAFDTTIPPGLLI